MITYKEYLKFFTNYFDQPRIERLGQSFLTTYFPSDVNSPLFYQTDITKSVEMIIENYVDPVTIDEFWNT